jgi:hypothetical protein
MKITLEISRRKKMNNSLGYPTSQNTTKLKETTNGK